MTFTNIPVVLIGIVCVVASVNTMSMGNTTKKRYYIGANIHKSRAHNTERVSYRDKHRAENVAWDPFESVHYSVQLVECSPLVCRALCHQLHFMGSNCRPNSKCYCSFRRKYITT